MHPTDKASELQHLYQTLRAQASYTPSPRINQLFSRLVSLAVSSDTAIEGLRQAERADLQSICSRAEYELELYWAKRIIESPSPQQELRLFPYFANYEKLTRLEWHTLRSCQTHDMHSVLFVGSGPLPLTAILLATEYIPHVTLLDYDKAACDSSTRLLQTLGLQYRIQVIHADAATFGDYDAFNTIFVAALAGTTADKKASILTKIKETASSDAHILARSSWGAREILYAPLDERLFSLFTPLVEVRPRNDVVNSIIVFENSYAKSGHGTAA